MRQPDVPLQDLNTTELLFMLSRAAYHHLRLKRGTPKERLIELVEAGPVAATMVRPEELADTGRSRFVLQEGIRKSWNSLNSQLPCQNKPNSGQCVVFPCSDGCHVNCYEDALRIRIVRK